MHKGYRLAFLILLIITGIFVDLCPAVASQKPYEELQFESDKPINIAFGTGTLSIYRFTTIFGGRGFTSTRYYTAFTDTPINDQLSPPSFMATIYEPPQYASEYFEDQPSVSDCTNTASKIFYNGKNLLVATFIRENIENSSDDGGTPTITLYQLQKRKSDEFAMPPYYFTKLGKKVFKNSDHCCPAISRRDSAG